MHGLALLLVALAVSDASIELEPDVSVIDRREFALPIAIEAGRQNEIDSLLIYVSQDRGNTWKLHKGYPPTAETAEFSAPKDGHYWFAVQIVGKDGKKFPAETNDLQAAQKVYVNGEGRAIKQIKTLKPAKTYEDLQREVESLRKTLEQLQKRIKELEKKQSP